MYLLVFSKFLVCLFFMFGRMVASEAASLVDEIVGDLWQGKAVPATKVLVLVEEVEKSLPTSRATSISSEDSESSRVDLDREMKGLCNLMRSKVAKEDANISMVEDFLAVMNIESSKHPIAAFEALGYIVSAY